MPFLIYLSEYFLKVMLNLTNKRIYLVKSNGRFGNQLFQILHALSECPKNSVILAFNFTKTKKVLSNSTDNVYFINLGNFLDRIIDLLFNLADKYKIFSIIDQGTLKTDAGIIHAANKKFFFGLFKNIILIKGFYQSSIFLSHVNKYTYKIFNKNLVRSSQYIFVHFRRSDYKTISMMNKSIVLDHSYYIKSVNHFRTIDPKTQFLIFSDEALSDSDLDLFAGNFYKFSNLSDPAEIYEEMLSCKGGIICNSSLSWLAGFHLKLIDENSLIIAPFNHIGHNIGIEIPEGINFNGFNYN